MRIPTALVVALLLVPAASSLDQRIKTVLVDEPLGSDPVRILKVMHGTTDLESDGRQYPNRYVWETDFYAGDDWLNAMSLVIKNVSKKNIIYVSVYCGLNETADWQEESVKHANPRSPLIGQISNHVGRRPKQGLYSGLTGLKGQPDTDRPPLGLVPGAEITVPLEDPDDFQALRSSIEGKEPISEVTACSGGISRIFFDDGTQWQGHHYMRANPDRPGHWITMSFEEWSGTPPAKPGENRRSGQDNK